MAKKYLAFLGKLPPLISKPGSIYPEKAMTLAGLE